MRLMISKSKNAQSLYAIKSVYENGKRSTKIVEKLGTLADLSKIHDDPIAWAEKYIEELTEKEKTESRDVLIQRRQSKRIDKDEQNLFNGGYLFLQQIYHRLGLHTICASISEKYKFSFNLNSILSRLVYGRIIFPTSKLGTLELSKRFLEPPAFEIQHIYRALEVISHESDFIQAELYKNSLTLSKRNDKILYYDCTNYFFEIEQAEGLKQYGFSKEHRPNPIVEMGLFMDGDGIPLAFCTHSGNTNEQVTLRPLEERIMRDFALSKFVVCTDAGLSSLENRKFNNAGDRAFITTQSVKKLKKHLKTWALDTSGWRMTGQKKKTEQEEPTLYDISQLENTPKDAEQYLNATFYKERWIKEDGLEQKLIVTFSLKYRNYQRSIRSEQIARAQKLIDTRPTAIKKHNQNDYKRFVKTMAVTADGELAEKNLHQIDQDTITTEEMYDGYYAVCTNFNDDPSEIAKINRNRWEIEECFRIMKTDFKARPVYLKRDDRIQAHFTTCFLALTLFRYLEHELKSAFTSHTIIRGLREMNFCAVPAEGYIPAYTRTDFTDALHDTFSFHTDFQILSSKQMKKIFKETKM